MNVRLYLSQDFRITSKSHFWHENVKILLSFTQHYNGHHFVMLLNLYTTSGLSILLHGVISLPGAKSCDKKDTNLPSCNETIVFRGVCHITLHF